MPKPETLGHQHVRWMQLGTTRLDTLQGVNKSVIESAIRRAWGIPKWKNLVRSNDDLDRMILTLYKIPTVKSGLNGYPKWVFLKYPKYYLEVLSPSGVSRSIYVSYQGEQSVRRDKTKEQRLYPVPRAPRLFRRQTVGTVDGIPVRGPAVGDLHWTRTPKTTLEARSQRTDSVRCS